MEYWNRGAMDTMSYHSNCYFGYNRLYPISTFCANFNKSIAEENNFGSIYDLVYDGSWTIDTMSELARIAAKDLDGDGRFTRNGRSDDEQLCG